MADERFDLAPLQKRVADLSTAYVASLPARHVGSSANGAAIAECLRVPLPALPEDPLAVIEQSEGVAWMGGTTWHGKAAMRISVSNWATSEDDIDRTADSILRAAAP